ncbi:hypothetical protein ES703_81119 [subsurface metagenome]
MSWLNNWKPKDVIALALVVGSFIMLGLGINGIMEYIILGVGAGYGIASMGHLVINGKAKRIEINPVVPTDKPVEKPAAPG